MPSARLRQRSRSGCGRCAQTKCCPSQRTVRSNEGRSGHKPHDSREQPAGIADACSRGDDTQSNISTASRTLEATKKKNGTVKTTFYRELGRSGIQVSALGMGCWAIGGPSWAGETPVGWGNVDDEESIGAVHRALELGVNFFDTADVYGAGHRERVLARALAGRRH